MEKPIVELSMDDNVHPSINKRITLAVTVAAGFSMAVTVTIIVVLGLLYASVQFVVVVLRFKVELRAPKVGVTKYGTPVIEYE